MAARRPEGDPMRRALTSGLAALALTGMLAGPSFAGAPAMETFELSDAFDIDCGAFTLHEEFTLTVHEKVWLDAAGNPTHVQASVTFEGTITGPGGIGSLSDDSHFTLFLDFGPNGDTERQVGLIFNFHAPGYGLVAHDAGVITFFPDGSVETQGPHDVWDNDARVESLICPLFE